MFISLPVDIYDEDKDDKDDSTPVASAVASRATQMVELLSRDNVALREKLENVYSKMNSMQMVNKEKHIFYDSKLRYMEHAQCMNHFHS